MTLRVLHWEAFATQPGQGNPAGVVLEAAHLSDHQMQEIARRMGFNETTFLLLPSHVVGFRVTYVPGSYPLPSGKKAVEVFEEAFHDKPELYDRFLRHWSDQWKNLPEEDRLCRFKLSARRVAEL